MPARFTDDEARAKWRAIEAAIAQGQGAVAACREAGVVERMFYRWRKRFAAP